MPKGVRQPRLEGSMRTLIISACALALSTVPTWAGPNKRTTPAPATPALYYDFKGAKLGITLEEWKALPFPGNPPSSSPLSRNAPPPVVSAVCAGDPGSEKAHLYQSNAEAAAGVTLCQYGYILKLRTLEAWNSAYIDMGHYQTNDIIYKFLDGRLYEISITGHDNLAGEMVSGLTAKFGPPTSVVNDTTQNRLGASFPHTVKTWKNPAAMVRLETPFSKIDNVNVTYRTAEGAARVNAAEKAANPDASKM